MYLPYLASYKYSLALNAAALICVVIAANLLLGLELVYAALAFGLAWALRRMAKKTWGQGRARKWGMKVEKKAVDHLAHHLAAYRCETEPPKEIVPGIGNIDALVKDPSSGRQAVVEIKSFQLEVHEGRLRRSRDWRDASSAARQVTDQARHIGGGCLPILWSPARKNYCETTEGGVVVIAGTPRFAAMKISQLLAF